MFKCEKHNATIPEKNCITRQALIAKVKLINSHEGKNVKGILAQNYNNYVNSCGGCETGLNLYKESLNGEEVMEKPTVEKGMKRCGKCIKPLPATSKYFGKNASAADGFSYYCRSCNNETAKETYEKKKSKKAYTPPATKKTKPEQPAKIIIEPKRKPDTRMGITKDVSNKPEVKMRTCSVCGNEFELNLENFHANPSSRDGFRDDCKVCRNIKKKEIRREKALNKDNLITLDFKDDLELLEKFKAYAKTNRRDIDQQILFEIDKICKLVNG